MAMKGSRNFFILVVIFISYLFVFTYVFIAVKVKVKVKAKGVLYEFVVDIRLKYCSTYRRSPEV